MPHVDVEPAAIKQKAAVRLRLLVVTVMKVDDTLFRLFEDEVLHASRPRVGTAIPAFSGDKAAILGFNSDNSIHRVICDSGRSFARFPLRGRSAGRTAHPAPPLAGEKPDQYSSK